MQYNQNNSNLTIHSIKVTRYERKREKTKNSYEQKKKRNACCTPQAVQCKQILGLRKSYGMVSTHDKFQN